MPSFLAEAPLWLIPAVGLALGLVLAAAAWLVLGHYYRRFTDSRRRDREDDA